MVQVPAVRNALQILNLLSSVGVPLTAARITAELDIPRSSVYHLLRALEEAGYVMHLAEEQTFGLGISAYALSNVYAAQQPLVNLGARYVQKAAELVSGSGHIARLVGPEILYLYDYRSPDATATAIAVGVRLSAALTASGKAMISVLPEVEARAIFDTGESTGRSWREFSEELDMVRASGYAAEVDVSVRGQQSLAVPVMDHLERPTASLTVTFPASHELGEERKMLVVEQLGKASRELSRRIFGAGAPVKRNLPTWT